jgi:hypothetical protein
MALPYVMMKFGQEEHLKQLQKGFIYMNPWTFFRNVENKEQKDIHEGIAEWLNPDITEMTLNGRRFTRAGGTLHMSFECENAEDYKIFCSTIIGGNDEFIGKSKIFDDRLMDFGEYFLFIFPLKEFFNKLTVTLDELVKTNVIETYQSDKVEYFDPDNYDGDVGPFKKTNMYKHQKEWRLVIKRNSLGSFSINIGDISNITFLDKTSNLINRIEKNPDTDGYLLKF